MSNTIYCLLLAVVLSSCQDSDKNFVSRLIREWDGKEIIFPTHSIFTIQGNDTVSYRIPKPDYKVVTFIDSQGCISCKLQLP